MRLIAIILYTASLCQTLSAQQNLQIGDSLPNLSFDSLFNTQKKSLWLDEYRGKRLILDFWTTYCLSCIESFPEMDLLQKEFPDSLAIVMVNLQSLSVISDFFAKHKKVIKPGLMFIAGDTVLKKLFPYDAVPVQVWIDQNGIVRSFTNSTKREFVKSWVTGDSITVTPLLKQIYLASAIDSNFFPQVEYFSLLSHTIAGRHALGDMVKPGYLKLSAGGDNISRLLLLAYGEGGKYDYSSEGRFNFHWHAPEKLKDPLYDYELLYPEKDSSQGYKYMQQDLTRYFNLTVKKRKVLKRCITLIKRPGPDKLRSKNQEAYDDLMPTDILTTSFGPIRRMINQPFQRLATRLQINIEYYLKQPFINKVLLNENIDFSIATRVLDNINFTTLRDELRKYNLDLIYEDSYIEVLDIR